MSENNENNDIIIDNNHLKQYNNIINEIENEIKNSIKYNVIIDNKTVKDVNIIKTYGLSLLDTTDISSNNISEDSHSYIPLDADVILKDLVERKCRNQFETFDLHATVQMLTKECDDAVEHLKSRKTLKQSQTNNRSSNYEELLDLSRTNKQDSKDFMLRLREKSLQTREKLIQR